MCPRVPGRPRPSTLLGRRAAARQHHSGDDSRPAAASPPRVLPGVVALYQPRAGSGRAPRSAQPLVVRPAIRPALERKVKKRDLACRRSR